MGLEGWLEHCGSPTGSPGRKGCPAGRPGLAVRKQDSCPALPVTRDPQQSHPAAQVTAFLCKWGWASSFLRSLQAPLPMLLKPAQSSRAGAGPGGGDPDSAGGSLWIPLHPEPQREAASDTGPEAAEHAQPHIPGTLLPLQLSARAAQTTKLYRACLKKCRAIPGPGSSHVTSPATPPPKAAAPRKQRAAASQGASQRLSAP